MHVKLGADLEAVALEVSFAVLKLSMLLPAFAVHHMHDILDIPEIGRNFCGAKAGHHQPLSRPSFQILFNGGLENENLLIRRSDWKLKGDTELRVG